MIDCSIYYYLAQVRLLPLIGLGCLKPSDLLVCIMTLSCMIDAPFFHFQNFLVMSFSFQTDYLSPDANALGPVLTEMAALTPRSVLTQGPSAFSSLVVAKQRENDELEDEYEKKKAASDEAIALAEAEANEANAEYEALKEEEAAIDAESPEAEAEKEMAETIRGGELLMEDGQKEIDEALEEYPVLAQLTVGLVRDPTMSEEEQKEQILAGLRESCEERVLAAEEDYKRRVEKAHLRRQQAKDERVRREAEEREAEESRRAEEEARRRRERKEREVRRREQERLEREEREAEERRREKEAARARKEAKRAAEEQRRREEE